MKTAAFLEQNRLECLCTYFSMSSRIITPGRFKRLDLQRWSRMHYVERAAWGCRTYLCGLRGLKLGFSRPVCWWINYVSLLLIRPNISALLEFASKQIFCLLFINDALKIIFSNIQILFLS